METSAKRNKRSSGVPAKKRGGQVCLVCSHPDRPELDRGLVAGSLTAASVARKIGCSRPSVSRHVKNHLIKSVNTALSTDAGEDIDLGVEIRGMYGKIKSLLVSMEDEPNWKALTVIHREVRGYLELLAKFLGKIESGNTVNVILSPGWLAVRGVILSALAPFPEARQATAQALLAYEKTDAS